MSTYTNSRKLRGRCYYRKGMWHWVVRDDTGKRLAYGEDRHLTDVWQNAHDVVFAVQVWSCFGRYKLWNPTGRQLFATEAVRPVRIPNYLRRSGY